MKLKFECCFCGKEIQSSNTDPCSINIRANIDKTEDRQHDQDFFCHLDCIKNHLTPKALFYIAYLT